MTLRIRLKRVGRRHRPAYRVTVVDGRKARDGRVIEEVGRYDPVEPLEERQVNLKRDRIEHWLSVGAQPSDTVRRILEKHGIIGAVASKSTPRC